MFGLPLIWRLGSHNDNRTVNAAAERTAVPMIATELGGGGGVDPKITDQAEEGIRNVLGHMGILAHDPTPHDTPRTVEIVNSQDSLYANGTGVFDRAITAGQNVSKGDLAGWFHYVTEPERSSEPLYFSQSGMVLAHTSRGMVKRGELLALVVQDVPATTT